MSSLPLGLPVRNKTRWLWENSPHKGNALLLLLAIVDEGEGEWVQVSHERLARKTGMSLRSVRKVLPVLEAAGAIEARPQVGKRRPKFYRVCTDKPRLVRTFVKRPEMSAALKLTVFRRDGFRCVYCGSSDDLTVDHLNPVSHGGTNVKENLQTLCRSCNSWKGTRQ